jgi:hypothetical protein
MRYAAVAETNCNKIENDTIFNLFLFTAERALFHTFFIAHLDTRRTIHGNYYTIERIINLDNNNVEQFSCHFSIIIRAADFHFGSRADEN